MKTGSCLCRAVTFELHGQLRPILACHCTQCRKTSGHYFAATALDRRQLRITRRDGLGWYRSSDRARRGFCSTCGSSLFWREDGAESISVAAGAIDGATGLHLEKHIYEADKGDYYRVPHEFA